MDRLACQIVAPVLLVASAAALSAAVCVDGTAASSLANKQQQVIGQIVGALAASSEFDAPPASSVPLPAPAAGLLDRPAAFRSIEPVERRPHAAPAPAALAVRPPPSA